MMHHGVNKIMINLVVLMTLISFITPLALAGDNTKITIGETFTFQSNVLGEERIILLSLPKGYDQSQSKYPVLYLLDGESHFYHLTGLIHFLSIQGRMPQVILVAIQNTDRNRDFTPIEDETFKTSGGGKKFISFLREELMPYIEKNYRTAPFTILAGHSLCGMFTVYTLLDSPDLFNAYIAIAPYLAYKDNYIKTLAESTFGKMTALNKFLYISVGEEDEEREHVKTFKQLLKNKAPDGLEWNIKFFDEEDHGSVPHVSVYYGLKSFFPHWKINTKILDGGVDAIKKHYQMLSKRYGYTIPIPEGTINYLGYVLLQRKEDITGAIEAFQFNVELYPDSANVYDSLGEGLEANEQYELALKNYKIAVQKGEKSSDPNVKIYEEHIKRVKDKME